MKKIDKSNYNNNKKGFFYRIEKACLFFGHIGSILLFIAYLLYHFVRFIKIGEFAFNFGEILFGCLGLYGIFLIVCMIDIFLQFIKRKFGFK